MTRRKRSKDHHGRREWTTAFVEGMNEQSDVAAVIVGAAALDDLLHDIITSFLIDEKEVEQLLGEFGPLGSFGARIRTAYCLGLITNEEYHNLRVIQRVRNAFAHNLFTLSLADEWVRNQLNTLKLPEEMSQTNRPTTPRALFTFSTTSLVFTLQWRVFKAEEERRVRLLDNGTVVLPPLGGYETENSLSSGD